MARIRSVHPELCIDETLASVSARAERTFVRLWPHLDDEGRTRDNPKLLKAALYPLHDDVTSVDVDQDIDELASVGLVVRYVVDGERYLTAKPDSWKRWQKPRHFYPSKLPSPEDARNDTSDNSVGRESDERTTTAGMELVGVEGRGGGEGAAADTSDVRPTSVRRLTQQQRRQIIHDAVTILTDRHLAIHPTTGSSPARHRDAVLKGKLEDHTVRGHELLHLYPRLTPETLAEILEPASAPSEFDDLVPASVRPRAAGGFDRDAHTDCTECDGHGDVRDENDEWVRQCTARPGTQEVA